MDSVCQFDGRHVHDPLPNVKTTLVALHKEPNEDHVSLLVVLEV